MKIQVKDKTLKVRKWRGRDKRNFMKEMQKKKPSEEKVMNALVYSCLEEINGRPVSQGPIEEDDTKSISVKDIVFSNDEFKYIISMIRAASLGDEIEYDFYCTECEEVHPRKYNITDIIRGVSGEGNTVEVQREDLEIVITLGEVRNKEFYLEKLKEGNIFDFLLRIENISINKEDNNTFDLDFLIDFFDDLDLDVLDEILKKYDDIRFKVEDINTFVCDCGHSEEFIFDEIPEFFPSSWFSEDFNSTFV